jgi:hypothetical protein
MARKLVSGLDVVGTDSTRQNPRRALLTPSSRYRRSLRALLRICSALNSVRGAIATLPRCCAEGAHRARNQVRDRFCRHTCTRSSSENGATSAWGPHVAGGETRPHEAPPRGTRPTGHLEVMGRRHLGNKAQIGRCLALVGNRCDFASTQRK